MVYLRVHSLCHPPTQPESNPAEPAAQPNPTHSGECTGWMSSLYTHLGVLACAQLVQEKASTDSQAVDEAVLQAVEVVLAQV